MTEDAYPFDLEQRLSGADAVRDLERCVLGCDYGGSSWTTRAEAERIAERLALRPGIHLLDLGAGSGWPGLYLARLAGCTVTLSDVPLTGLRQARQRAAQDGLDGRCGAVVADAAALPLAAASFDAITHSDVLCCMPAKEAMLRECRAVARPAARMLFSVIAPARGLAPAERALAEASGPPHVMVAGDYAELLADAGWDVLEREDVSDAYHAAVGLNRRGLLDAADALAAALGQEEYARRLQRRTNALAAIEGGLLKREIFLCAPA